MYRELTNSDVIEIAEFARLASKYLSRKAYLEIAENMDMSDEAMGEMEAKIKEFLEEELIQPL